MRIPIYVMGLFIELHLIFISISVLRRGTELLKQPPPFLNW